MEKWPGMARQALTGNQIKNVSLPAFQQELFSPNFGSGKDLKCDKIDVRVNQYSIIINNTINLGISSHLPSPLNSHLMDLAGSEATEGREGPQSPARLGVTFRVRRNRILSPLILLHSSQGPSPHPSLKRNILIF